MLKNKVNAKVTAPLQLCPLLNAAKVGLHHLLSPNPSRVHQARVVTPLFQQTYGHYVRGQTMSGSPSTAQPHNARQPSSGIAVLGLYRVTY